MSCCPTYRPQELIIEPADYLESLIGTVGCSTFLLAAGEEGSRPTVTSTGLIQFSTLTLADELSGLGTADSPLRFSSGTPLTEEGWKWDGTSWALAPWPTVPSANTFSSLGGGEPVYAGTVASDVQFKSLVAGSNVTFSSTGDEITINATTNLTSYQITDTSFVDGQFGGDSTAQAQSYAYPFRHIANAIAATNSATIIVNSGSYTENLTLAAATRNIFANGYCVLDGTLDTGPSSHPIYIRGFRIQGKVTANAFRIVVFTNCHFVNTSASTPFLDVGAHASVTFENCLFQHINDVPIVNFLDNPGSGVPNQVIFSGCKILSLNGGGTTSYIATGPVSGSNCSVAVLSPLYSNWSGTGVQNLAGLKKRPSTLISTGGLVVDSEMWI